ncbi:MULTISPECIES: LysE family translocator [unclassified Janthinobacterium]|uniref:LysE family translocator n=1 Tax=unclassified Janthinobacterium TaxID=2610881 RepID=UPI001857A29B|nr:MULTISPECIES: LysE family translocator [unclassified Janthinobacterium]MBB5605639.1 threonine/homoserine/homoserine lactone efflux protein [Janthinobacterium sp. S3T4]MBB5611442.1 threonine/homoserine/homoserine lactone efflux protein [Janthinobacterium sp. S3M3]
MSDSTFLMYLLALAGAFLLPGPDMALVLATGAARGVGTALVTAVGIAGARAVHVTLSGAGLATLMVAHPQALQWVKWAGAAYLFYLAARLLQSALSKSNPDSEAAAPATEQGARASLVRGFLTNLLNPKALLFCSMFLPQFVNVNVASASMGMQYLRLGATLVLMGLLFDAIYAVLAARLARRLRGKPSPYGKFVLPTVFVLLAGRLVMG